MTENTPTPPNSKFAGRMLLFGSVTAALALVVGLSPLTANGHKCGSVLRPAGHWFLPLSCDDVLSLVRIPVVVLGLCALVGFIFGGMAALIARADRQTDR
ncbi:hypothetical protein AB0C10_26975 [Microbispora amethystogenes]|uniref:hypothetical protein n=1 Tax=Microbispora amethystogenes TaxID=1427754 RepID=UPI0033F22FE9